jgi:hypothetical protein
MEFIKFAEKTASLKEYATRRTEMEYFILKLILDCFNYSKEIESRHLRNKDYRYTSSFNKSGDLIISVYDEEAWHNNTTKTLIPNSFVEYFNNLIENETILNKIIKLRKELEIYNNVDLIPQINDLYQEISEIINFDLYFIKYKEQIKAEISFT